MLQDPRQRPPATRQELSAMLQRATVFSRLPDAPLQTLARRTRLVALAAGETLFRHGDKARALYLLVQGQLKLFRTSASGDEMIVELLEPGATFAESRAFLEDPHFHVSCAALVDAEVAAVDLPTFVTVLHDSVDTCLLLLRQMSERAERHIDDIDRLALQSGTGRVAGYLLAQLPPGRDEYPLKVAKGVMASRLGIRAETLSRILKQLSAEGVVSVSSRNIVRVHSRQKLQRLALQTGPRRRQ